MREEMLSVGIDIGTSTTQLVFSKLIIQNMASDYTVPRIEIVGKEIIYRSAIYFTPLKTENMIDGEAIARILEKEYEMAGVDKRAIRTGAVIITGETAGKDNAAEILSRFSDFAGDFVVATAGPDLESIISGKGAGADIFSKEASDTVVNMDIGGGTSNLAVFKNGHVKDTGCLDIGGRILKVNDCMEVTYISKKLEALIRRHGWPIRSGERVTEEALWPLTDRLAQILEMSVGLRAPDEDLALMVTNHALSYTDINYISFSGGVAEAVYDAESIERKPQDLFKYGDIGLLLGLSIRRSQLFSAFKIFESREKIRATVVGAGSHTTKISGSTVSVSEKYLPVKNLPIIKIEPDEEFTSDGNVDEEGLRQAVARKMEWFFDGHEKQNTAVAITGLISPAFSQIQAYAAALYEALTAIQGKDAPLIIIVGNDMAKVLGQTIFSKSGYRAGVISLDGIELEQGDYIDIGRPAAGGSIVPVVVKTLVFH